MLLGSAQIKTLKKKATEGRKSSNKYLVDQVQKLKIKEVSGEVKGGKNIITVLFENAINPESFPVVYKYYYVDHQVAMSSLVNLMVGTFNVEPKAANDIKDLASQVKKLVGKELKAALRLKPSFFTKEDNGEIKAFSSYNYDLWYTGNKNEDLAVDAGKVILPPDTYFQGKIDTFKENNPEISIEYTDSRKYFSDYVEEKNEDEVEEENKEIQEGSLLSQDTIENHEETEAEDDDMPF
jgi:hypothetical protein